MNSKLLLSVVLSFSLGLTQAQNVGVNKTGTTPDASSILDLNSGNPWGAGTSKGLLIPNVALTGIHDNSTILLPATSLMVYNTATGGGVTPGYYYNSNTPGSPTWTQMGAGAGGSSWLLVGNATTTPGTNFVGTTDANDLVFKTDGTENMRIVEANGNVGVNEPGPLQRLEATTGIAGGAGNWNKGIPATSGTTQNGIFRLEPSTEALGGFGEVMDFGMNVAPNPSPSFAWIQATNKTDLSSKYLMALNPNGGNVGIAETNPKSSLDVNGNATIGTYAGVTAAPANGLTVSGQVGIGIATPNVGSALDVTSTTQGILIPRMPANPAGTATSLMYYNTTSGCFMFYNGTGWQAMACGCTGVPATPVVTGPATYCPAGTGAYSITAIPGALSYTWTVPSGTTITSGQGTTSINVTYGSVAGNISCNAVNSCGVSNAGSLAITEVISVPITLTNSQATPTPSNFQQMITVNSSTYSAYENAGLNNVEFSSLAGGTGTIYYAWIESGASSASTSTVYWVNLAGSTIPAGGNITVYMNFMASTIMTSTASFTGEAPQLSGTYGQYDNGAQVFTFYDGFPGSSLSANWTSYSFGAGTLVVNNGITITSVGSANSTNVITSVSSYAPSVIAETYAKASAPSSASRSYMPALISNTATAEGQQIEDDNGTTPTTSYVGFGNGRSALIEYSWLQSNTTIGGAPYADYNEYQTNPTVGTYYVFSIYYTGSANFMYLNYAKVATGNTTYSPTGSLYFALGDADYTGPSSTNFSAYWARLRNYPPSTIMPTTAFGATQCP